MSRRRRIAFWIGVSLVALTVGIFVAGLEVLRSAWFAKYVSRKIVSVTEDATGGRVEVGNFVFDWKHLRARLTNFVLHGKEPGESLPLLKVDAIELQLKLLPSLKKTVDLRYLGVYRPVANVIVFPDGTTNIPEPKVPSKSNNSALQTVVDLAIHQFDLKEGSVHFAEEKIPLELHGRDLRAVLMFEGSASVYEGNVSFGGVQLTQVSRSPIEASVNVPVTIGKDRVELNNATVSTGKSSVTLSGSFKNPEHPVIDGHVVAHVSLAELRQATGLAAGACTQGAPCFADADVDGHLDQHSAVISKANLVLGKSHVDASSSGSALHFEGTVVVDEIGRLFQFSGERIGTVQLAGILKSAPNRIEISDTRIEGLGGAVTVAGSMTDLKSFELRAKLVGFQLTDLERLFLSTTQGYAASLLGTLEASGDISLPGVTGLHARTRIDIAPENRGVPLKGHIDGEYEGRSNQIKISRAILSLPHSQLTLAGVIGRRVSAEFVTTDTRDLYPVLTMTMKEAPAEIPVTINGGRVEVHARVEGPLSSPSIDGEVAATRFAVEKRGFDRLNVDLTASQAGVNILDGSLTRGTMQASFSGSVGLKTWALTSDQPVRAKVDLRNGELPDLLALAGEGAIPATGRLTASANVSGTVGNPLGAINVTATEGSLYGEVYHTIDLQAAMLDQLIQLNRAEWIGDAGRLQANGTYSHPRDSLVTGDLKLHAASTQLRLNAIATLSKQRAGIDGTLQMDVDAAARVQRVKGHTEADLTSIRGNVRADNIHDQARNYGSLSAQADTSRSTVTFRADSNVSGSSTHIAGQMLLTKDYPTTADVSIQNLALEKLPIDLGVPVKGMLAINAHAQGTLADPVVTAQASLVNAAIDNEPIDTLQVSGRYTAQIIDISSLQLSAPAGSVTLNGRFNHPDNQFGSGTIQAHLATGDLRIDKIHYLESLRPGLGGVLKVSMDAAGELKTSGGQREIHPTEVNATVALTGASYSGKPAGAATLTATSAGDSVNFALQSDLAKAAIRAQGNLKLTGDYPIAASFSATDLRFSNLRSFLNAEAVPADVDALAEIDGNVAGSVRDLDQIKANVRLPRFEVNAKSGRNAAHPVSLALRNEGAIEVQLDHSIVTVRSAHIKGPRGMDLAIAGTAAFAGTEALNLSVKSNVDLGLLQDVDRDIYSSGAVSVDAALGGSFSAPIASGSILLKNASVNVAGVSNGISNANGTIALSGSRATIRNLSGESGGGKIVLSGFAAYTGGAFRYNLRASATRVRTRQQGISIVNNASLTLNGTTDQGIISGTITVVSVGINPQSDLGSILSPAPPAEASGEQVSPFLSNTRLDVRIRTAPDVRFQSTLAEDLQADGDVSLVGTLSNPGMTGRVVVSEGNLIFFGNEYTVNHGVISFYNPLKIEPQLDVSLETTVESVDVVLTLKGKMDNLKLSYRSDPPLRFDEVVGLLAAGRQPTSDPTLVANQLPPPQQSVGEMGESAIVSQAIASPVSSRLQRVFGITQLRIDPTFVSGSSLPQASLSLQQRVANNVTFTYTQDYSQANSELVRVEWALSPRFSAVATRDINGIFGVDFFYKKQFK